MDHLAHPVVSRLVLLLCQFAAFAYYVIDSLISVVIIIIIIIIIIIVIVIQAGLFWHISL